jgi:hypothetical protein
MHPIRSIVAELLPALLTEPTASSAAAQAVLAQGPRGVHELLQLLRTAPADSRARGSYVADGLWLAFHSRRLLNSRIHIVLSEATEPQAALQAVSEHLGADVDTGAAPIPPLPLVPPGRYSAAELLDAVTAQMPGWIWQADGEGRVRLLAGERPAFPGVHAGTCQVQVVALSCTRGWDARGLYRRSELQLCLYIEPPIQRLFVPTLAVDRIEEASGRLHTLASAQMRLPHGSEVLRVEFAGPRARAEELAGIYGRVCGRLPLDYAEAERTALQPGAALVTPTGRLDVERVHPQGCRMRFLPAASDVAPVFADGPDGLGLSLVMLGVDDRGHAAIGRLRRIEDGAWELAFDDPDPAFGPPTRLHYRTVSRFAGFGHPFCIRGVPLRGAALRRRNPRLAGPRRAR